MGEHTPGPYKRTKAKDTSGDMAIWAQDRHGLDLLLAEVYHQVGAVTFIDPEANARLFEAAPDMYDFIEGIAMGRCCQTEGCCTDDPSCDTMEARAIIAKVRGES